MLVNIIRSFYFFWSSPHLDYLRGIASVWLMLILDVRSRDGIGNTRLWLIQQVTVPGIVW